MTTLVGGQIESDFDSWLDSSSEYRDCQAKLEKAWALGRECHLEEHYLQAKLLAEAFSVGRNLSSEELSYCREMAFDVLEPRA